MAGHLPGTSCRVFPVNNYWHADISKLPVNRHSAQWLSHMSPGSHLHPDFGPSFGAQPVPYGIPVTVVAHSHPRVHVHFTYANDSDDVGYPLDRFTTDFTDRRYIWPARHQAGSVNDSSYPPMGVRFRLKASFPISSYRKDIRVVLRAMKRYGLVLADNGSPWYFEGTAQKGWPNAMLDQLKTVPATAFEAVDTSPLKYKASSAAVAR